MRITKRSNIAMRALMYCALNEGRLVTRAEVAARCNASDSHLAQVINQLGQLGYLATQRGRGGGIALGRPATGIAIGEVFRAIETAEQPTGCFADVDNTCPLTDACRLRPAIGGAVEAFYAHLDGMTLDELVCGNTALHEIFMLPKCTHAA